MIAPDVNVLVYAFRRDAEEHEQYRDWLETALAGEEVFGVAELVLSGFVRIVTHPRVFAKPNALQEALGFAHFIMAQTNVIRLRPGEGHWSLFADLCQHANAKGNLVPDAYLAALAMEAGATWITTDRDFARFPGLRWRHPLAAE